LSKGSPLDAGRAAVPSSVTSSEGMSASLSDVNNANIVPQMLNNVKEVVGGLPTAVKNQVINELVNLLTSE
jgi:hypothetical protein